MTDRLPKNTALFGLTLAAIRTNDFIDLVLDWASAHETRCRTIAYLNAHTVNLLHRKPEYRQAMEKMDLLYADGMAVVRASQRIAEVPLPERVNAGDFIERFLWAAQAKSRRIALLGSDEATVQQCAATLQARVDGLQFCFTHHGYFPPEGPQEDALAQEIRHARPDIILAGMGSPRQELWAQRMGGKTGARVIWCVGALFEYYADRRRAPVWMREAGLEWLFRLVLEPRRMAPRYLVGNIEFQWRVMTSARNQHR